MLPIVSDICVILSPNEIASLAIKCMLAHETILLFVKLVKSLKQYGGNKTVQASQVEELMPRVIKWITVNSYIFMIFDGS